MGLQASGKSSFYRERYFHSHARISMDLLKTRFRERLFLDACLSTDQRFVIDNTNPTRAERAPYIEAARTRRYQVTGYYFRSALAECQERNIRRQGVERIPDHAVAGTSRKLELPSLDEGFDRLFYVRLVDQGFEVEEWNDEIRRPRPPDASL
ncbi:MAG TPA: AAA family ATPase [Caulifigura sp.]|nr:AAA family ATPase [Caulifigura sp.]